MVTRDWEAGEDFSEEVRLHLRFGARHVEIHGDVCSQCQSGDKLVMFEERGRGGGGGAGRQMRLEGEAAPPTPPLTITVPLASESPTSRLSNMAPEEASRRI